MFTQVNDQAGAVQEYVGIGEKKETNGSISTVYYAVTKTGETYTAGSELTMNTTYQWKNSGADGSNGAEYNYAGNRGDRQKRKRKRQKQKQKRLR